MSNDTEHNCLSCGTDISNKRKDAKYCNDRCRMRYRRKEQKEDLIADLIEIFFDLPNHSAYFTDDGFYFEGWNALTRNPQKWEVSDLKKMSIRQLKDLLKDKKWALAVKNISHLYNSIKQQFKR